jgi:DNA-binding NarL/FixJ family response regulator
MRVIVGEDEPLYREGLVRLLTEGGYDVVAVAADADELVRKVAGHRPEIVVTDVRMPPSRSEDGLEAAITIRERFPGTAVLVLSHYVAQRPALELFGTNAEGVGYLLKDRVADLDQFLEAVRRIARGGSVLDPAVVTSLMQGARSDPLDQLTSREREVLTLVAAGRSNRGIAEVLVVTEDAFCASWTFRHPRRSIGGSSRSSRSSTAPDRPSPASGNADTPASGVRKSGSRDGGPVPASASSTPVPQRAVDRKNRGPRRFTMHTTEIAFLGIDTTAEITSAVVIVVFFLTMGAWRAWKLMSELQKRLERSDQTP